MTEQQGEKTIFGRLLDLFDIGSRRRELRQGVNLVESQIAAHKAGNPNVESWQATYDRNGRLQELKLEVGITPSSPNVRMENLAKNDSLIRKIQGLFGGKVKMQPTQVETDFGMRSGVNVTITREYEE